MNQAGETVAIIGGGPSGLIAAERLAEHGVAVEVFERMPSVGRKLLLAGRGGLNLTHSEPLPALLRRYGPAEAALSPALLAWPPDAVRAWCAALGQPTFIGSSGRVFPAAFKATPLLRAWLRRLSGQGVRIHTRKHWLGWDENGSLRFADGHAFRPAATILAMGGASWPRLGSDGGWVPELRCQGVDVHELRAANAGVLHPWSDSFQARFQGQPLKRVGAECGGEGVRGEAMVTASGLEGGVAYALSRAIRAALDATGSAVLTLDLRPDLDAATLSQRLGGRGQSMANALRRAGLSPAASGLVRELNEDAPLVQRVKAARLSIVGMAGLDRAISSAGGIALSGLDRHGMLTARPGVFAAGEMLDWEAPTGGYLLQAAFSTGRFAADGVVEWLRHGVRPG